MDCKWRLVPALLLVMGGFHIRAQLSVTYLPDTLFSGSSTSVVEGSVLWLYCEANSTSSSLSVSWSKDGGSLVQDVPHIRLRTSTSSSSTTLLLVLDNVVSSDTGVYQCTAQDGLDTASGSGLTIKVLSSSGGVLRIVTQDPLTEFSNPIIYSSQTNDFYPNRTAVNNGTMVTLSFTAGHVGDDMNSYTTPTAVWLKDGVPARTTPTNMAVGSNGQLNSTLFFTFQESDAGVYQCIFILSGSGSQMYGTIPLRLDTGSLSGPGRVSPPVVFLTPPDELVLEVKTSGRYDFIVWSRVGDRSFRQNRTAELVNFHEIFVRQPTTTSEYGRYKASYPLGEGETMILVVPTASPNTTAVDTSSTAIVSEEDNVNISCTSSGGPIPTVTWTLKHQPTAFSQTDVCTNPTDITTPGHVMSTLHIVNAQYPTHNGVYTCTGTNTISGSTRANSANITVQVQVEPEVELSQTRQFMITGDIVHLRCEVVRGNPMNYTFEWKFMNTTPSIFMTQTSHSILTINNFSEENSGTYNCSAKNIVGTGEDSIQVDYEVLPALNLTVWPPTDNWVAINSNLVVTCQVIEGNLPINLTLTHPSYEARDVSKSITAINSSISISVSSTSVYDYGNYTCIASNEVGVENETVLIQQGIIPKVDTLNSNYQVTIGDSVTLKFRVEEASPNEVFTEWYYVPITMEDDSNRYLNNYSPIMGWSINSPDDVNITLEQIGLRNSSLGEGRYYLRASNVVGSNKSYADVTFINLDSTENGNGSHDIVIGAAVGVFAFILVLATVILVVLLKKKLCKSSYKISGTSAFDDDDYCPMSYMAPEEGSHVRQPIPVSFLYEHVLKMSINVNCGYEEEFQIIHDKSPMKPVEASSLPQNKTRNRFKNIKCFDETRVVLTPVEGVEHDYINANIVDGYSRSEEYIVSQGPLKNTMVDFWRMVWQYRTSTIVMLTNLHEKTKKKCSQYWPATDQTESYGPFHVELVETNTLANFVIRDLTIEMEATQEKRSVRQFHFTSWPDYGVPRHASPILHYIRRVRSFHTYTHSRKLLIHCSAGVGRSGTFITLDIELQRAIKEKCVDPFNTVCRLREQRSNMVQTEAQYIFLHDAILEGVQTNQTEVPLERLGKYMRGLEATKKGVSGYNKEFKLLEKLGVDMREVTNANDKNNRRKNRLSKALPYNFNRVNLRMKIGEAGSDYINASYIDSYSQKNAFIATQCPLEDTAEDFWRMVWEKSATTIVMLSQPKEYEEGCCLQYWPVYPDSPEKYGKFSLEITWEQFQEDYVMRQIQLSLTETGESRAVVQYHFTSWPEHGTPSSCTGILDFIGQVERERAKNEDKPLIVHCSDGVDRTGAFCTICVAMEQAREEDVVDIFHTVKHLRTQRPHMVQALEQYIFCYRFMQDFITSLSLYSTFT